jgi:ferrochelatase
VSFGGPEAAADVMPFLRNVVRGRGVPDERLAQVAEHYHALGGRSPLNAQNRALATALESALLQHGLDVPVLLGNRNWHPYLAETVAQARLRGVERAAALYTSPYGCFSSCRQYTMDLERSVRQVGAGAPEFVKVRAYFNHPRFIAAAAARAAAAIETATGSNTGAPPWDEWALIFTAHSIPVAMAATGPYEAQLAETARLVAEALGAGDWSLAYQSRSGPPGQPWLGPDVDDALQGAKASGRRGVLLCPIGFISDHVEVLHDLDVEAAASARALGLEFVRSETVGTHPEFVRALAEQVMEVAGGPPAATCGQLGPAPNPCQLGCCAYGPAHQTAPGPA